MRRISLLLPLFLAACGGDAAEDTGKAAVDSAAAAAAAPKPDTGVRGVFYTLQDAGVVGNLADTVRWAAGSEPTYLDISADGRLIAVSATAANSLIIIDARTGTAVDTIPVGKQPKGVRFAGWPGTVFVANEGSGTVGVVTLRDGTMQEVAVGDMPHAIELDVAGDLMYVTLQGGGGVAVVDTEMMQLVETIPLDGKPHNAVLSDDRGTLYLSLLDRQEVIKLDGARTVLGRVKLGGPHYGVELSPDEKWLYVTAMAGSKLHVIDAQQMQEVAQVEVGLGPHGVRTNPAGDEVYVTVAGTNEIVVVDAITRTVKRRVPAPGKPFWIVVR